ncbi:MAG TPA: hypothetical protein VMF89_03160 [Polyangiales bacterium]|nr:hypothetical protein [Polyangiales bacterium]
MRQRFILGLALFHSACAHTASPAPATTVEQKKPVRAVPTKPDGERGLYDIILRLAQDPAAQAQLAPGARVVFHGEETTDEPLGDAYKELSWVREAKPSLATGSAPPPDSEEESVVRCVAAELRCSIEQPGGETIFRFAYTAEGPERRVVLSTIEIEEP